MEMLDQLEIMTSSLNRWFESIDYIGVECNYVPPHLFSNNRRWNFLLRTLFRLCPFNIRRFFKSEKGVLTPQTQVALLKAYGITGEKRETIKHIYTRLQELKSEGVVGYALSQGIRISINLYENSASTPTPLNTVWLGQFLLDDANDIIPETEKEEVLLSIAKYIVEDLSYADFGDEGIYFYYGVGLKKVIYNASALMSAFLYKVGVRYGRQDYIDYACRGIKFIVNNQNAEGSWFYAASPERKTIDCFHQSYILQALQAFLPEYPHIVQDAILRGEQYYKSFFKPYKNQIRPTRYDRRFTPSNTWLFVKVDGRDVADALVYFSKYSPDQDMVKGLLNYLYEEFYTQDGFLISEIFVYGKNKIPYSEFQAWYLYALMTVYQKYREQ